MSTIPTLRSTLEWMGATVGAIAIALVVFHWCENRREQRARAAAERAKRERHERFLAAEMAMRVRNERRHLHPVVWVGNRAQKPIPAAQLQAWLTIAFAVEEFRKELAALPEVEEP